MKHPTATLFSLRTYLCGHIRNEGLCGCDHIEPVSTAANLGKELIHKLTNDQSIDIDSSNFEGLQVFQEPLRDLLTRLGMVRDRLWGNKGKLDELKVKIGLDELPDLVCHVVASVFSEEVLEEFPGGNGLVDCHVFTKDDGARNVDLIGRRRGVALLEIEFGYFNKLQI